MSPSGLGGNLADFDGRMSPVGSCSPGRNPSGEFLGGAPVRELIWHSVLGEPLVGFLQEPMPGEKSLEYAIQATASVWMLFEQVHDVESGDVDFDSFGMASWNAGGMHDDRCQLREALQTMMLQWLMRLLMPTSDCARTR